jgi:hypothetical protein
MPRNGSGVYSKPAGTTAVPNTTIESAKFNQVVDDLVQDANFARPITAGGTGAESVPGAQAALSLDNRMVYAYKPGNYTAVADDNNSTIFMAAASTLALTAAATLGLHWHITVFADVGDVTIDPSGSEVINGATTLVIPAGSAVDIICTGTSFVATSSFRTRTAANRFVGGWEFIAFDMINSAVAWTRADLGVYRFLMIDAFIVNASDSSILFRYSLNNGTTYDAGTNYGYANSTRSAGPNTFFGSGSSNGAVITGSSATFAQFQTFIANFNSASAANAFTKGYKQTTATGDTMYETFATHNIASALSAIQLINTNGVAMTGTIILRGLRG